MNERLGQLYVAHSANRQLSQSTHAGSGIGDVPPEQVAEYVACLLNSLHLIAKKSQLLLLAELISIAEDEARDRSSAS
jgi:hypothetical protein